MPTPHDNQHIRVGSGQENDYLGGCYFLVTQDWPNGSQRNGSSVSSEPLLATRPLQATSASQISFNDPAGGEIGKVWWFARVVPAQDGLIDRTFSATTVSGSPAVPTNIVPMAEIPGGSRGNAKLVIDMATIDGVNHQWTVGQVYAGQHSANVSLQLVDQATGATVVDAVLHAVFLEKP